MSTPTVIQSCAALYGIVPGAAGVTFVNGQIGTGKAFATEDAMLNHYYEATFTVWAPKTTAQVASLIVANLGLTGATATSEAARIAGLLDGVAMPARGAKVKEIVTAFEATPAAATFNAAKAALVTAVADPTYQGIPGKGVGELVFASLSPAQIQLGTSEAINTVLLTTGVDTVPGSTGTELITGGVTSLSSTDTLQVTDQINGGTGNDSLLLSVSKDFGGFTVGTGFLKGVEAVTLTNTAPTVARSFSFRGTEDVKTINISGEINVTGLASISGLTTNLSNLTDSGETTISLGFNTEAVSGSSDALTVGLSGVGREPTTSTGQPAGHTELTTTGVETLTLNATGSNFIELGTGDGSAKALVVTGSGNLRLADGTGSTVAAAAGGVSSLTKTIDATGLAGTFDVDLGRADSIT